MVESRHKETDSVAPPSGDLPEGTLRALLKQADIEEVQFLDYR